ncbi:MAG: DUF2892 domain-containing protein [Phycisphaerales bacterium]
MALCKNVGSVDRGLRALVGVVALVLAFTQLQVTSGAVAGIVAAAVGVVMLLTAALGMCPLYIPLGLTTCKTAAR